MNVADQAALVTGAGSGLGEATARGLAQAGARVAVLDINYEAASKVAGDIDGVAIECDVSDEQSAEQAVSTAAQQHGAARVLVNCAGIAPPGRIVGRDGPMPLADFKRVIDINLVGTFNLMRLAAADMQSLEPMTDAGERGVIINTSSVAAFEGQVGQAAYAASKGAIVALTIQSARELARSGVRVMTIAPGIMGTPLLTGLPEDVQRSLASQVPFPARLGHPSEFADLALHLVSNEMLNGEVIRLDGAIRMAPK